MSNHNDFETTEDALALHFAAKYEDQLRYDHSEGSWYEFKDGLWLPDRTERRVEYARDLAREAGEALRDASLTRNLGRIRFAKAVLEGAKADKRLAITMESWNKAPLMLGVPGGVVNLRDGVIQPPNPLDFISQQTSIRPNFERQCPIWMRFLGEVTGGDDELVKYLQRLAGYCLTGDTKEQKLHFLYGDGGNGKSIFIKVLSECLGSYAQTAAMDTFTATKTERHSTELAMLAKARLVTASETDNGRSWNEARIKEMTGGDKVTARFMRQDFFTFEPRFKILISGNYKPQLGSVTDAMKRRLVIINFNYKPEVADADLPEKLKTEYPAILAWMILGAVEWCNSGLCPPKAVTMASNDYLASEDVFGEWLEECCELSPERDDVCARSGNLWDSWKKHAEKQRHPVGSSQEFVRQLSRHKIERYRRNTGRFFRGIKLRLPPTETAE